MLAGDKPSVDGAVSGICVATPAEPVKAPALTLTLLFVCVLSNYSLNLSMSFTQLNYHIIFSTKNRVKSIAPQVERRIYTLLYVLSLDKKAVVHRIGGYEDHVHMLVSLPSDISLSEYIKYIKQNSSRIIGGEICIGWTGWEEGYGAFTLRNSDIDTVKEYIVRQKEHHRHVPFIEEYRNWLIEQGISPEEPFFPKV